MSMTISKMPAPRGRSRTSTHATSVPITALTSAAAIERPMVSCRASIVVESVIAAQKLPQPEPNALPTTAASGISTSRLSQMTMTPRDVPEAAPNRKPVRACLRPDVAEVPTTEAAGTSSNVAVTSARLDLRDDAVVAEELVVHDAPPTEVVNGGEVRRRGERVARVVRPCDVGDRHAGHR